MPAKTDHTKTIKAEKTVWIDLRKGYPHLIFRVRYEGAEPRWVSSIWACDGQRWESSNTGEDVAPATVRFGAMRLGAFFAILELERLKTADAKAALTKLDEASLRRLSR